VTGRAGMLSGWTSLSALPQYVCALMPCLYGEKREAAETV
jgi:hypothetical protein